MKSEPHKIKTVRNLNITTYYERSVILREAFYNTFNIHSNKVTYDLVSQGSSAKSQDQEAGSLIGDETYAGSRNFEKLQGMVNKTFGHQYVCPTHNLQGAIKLIVATMVTKGAVIPSNSSFPELLIKDFGGKSDLIEKGHDKKYKGNIKLDALSVLLSENNNVPFIYFDLYVDGYKPVSMQFLKEAHVLASTYQVPVVVNVSQSVEWAGYVRDNDAEYSGRLLSEIVKEMASFCEVMVLDAAQDPRCNVGGLIGSNNFALYERYMNEVVVYEGLHTYGGMAGRTMELFARGIDEMVYEPQAGWIKGQIELLSAKVEAPHYVGADGIYLKAYKILPHIKSEQANALAAMLYLKAGMRCLVQGIYDDYSVLPVQLPRLGFTNDQIDFLARAINEVYSERDKLTHFVLLNMPQWIDQAQYNWNNPTLSLFNYECEAYRIYTIEYIGVTTKEERQSICKEVGYNTFLLPSKDVGIDLLTDSGTCAQTTIQWSKYNEGDETPASSKDYFEMVDMLKEVTGYNYIIPTHQGRAAEHIMSQILIKDGFVPGNMYFTTTKLHQEMAGGTFVDVICDEAHDPQSDFIWKGNIDIKKIETILDEHGEGSIPYISFEFSVNLAGGQPVSMDNVREVYLFCKAHNIPVMFDATRAVENAYMIKKKDERYHHVPIKDILRELFSYGDGCTVSSKKDYLVNIGGFLGIREDQDFYEKALSMIRIYEGTRTTGGMSAGDMSMHAEGVREMLDFNYIMARVEQTQYLGNRLLDAGIPIVEPIGTHAVFIDAKRFLPHIDQDKYPAQSLASELYIESGIRAMERGNVSSGRNRITGENYRPCLELVRLTIPRRAYTKSHMDLVADSIIELYKRRDEIKGLEFVYEPENLRFFQGKFEHVD
ncbi:tryptophanase [Plebeiibacterium marinum]|uniref:Tryptophanase n=1 Tax=Plebeiibacterium marinum TaxID=2992111 RepID=A0AAE3SLZ0_9BACT|nr:tryptophanase [Plebeiobacterium marinum]MCW3807010.1 tryptophanase [Plebeiobacterium marinum]